MVNIFTLFGGFMLCCWLAARYGKRPAQVFVRFAGWFKFVPKWPVMLIVFVLVMLDRNEADAGVVDFVGGIIGAVGGELVDIVSGMFEAVRAAILQAFTDLICLIIEEFGGVLLTAIHAIPQEATGALESVKPYMDICNSWLPLSDAMVWFAAYLTFLVIQIPTKLIIKIFIPTVG